MNKLMIVVGLVIIGLSSCTSTSQFTNTQDDVYYSRKASNKKAVMVPNVDVDEIIKNNPPTYGQPTNSNYEETTNPNAAAGYPAYKAQQDSLYTLNPSLSGYYYEGGDPVPYDEQEEAQRLRNLYGSDWTYNNYNSGWTTNNYGYTPGYGYNNYNGYGNYYGGYGYNNWGYNPGWNLGIGWNSYNGWNTGIGFGWGSSFYNPYGGWGAGYYPYSYGGWGYNPWYWGGGYYPYYYNNGNNNGENRGRGSVQQPRTGSGSSAPAPSSSGGMQRPGNAQMIAPGTTQQPAVQSPVQQQQQIARPGAARLENRNGQPVYIAPSAPSRNNNNIQRPGTASPRGNSRPAQAQPRPDMNYQAPSAPAPQRQYQQQPSYSQPSAPQQSAPSRPSGGSPGGSGSRGGSSGSGSMQRPR